jgi:acetate kinase
MRTLLASQDSNAKDALALFVFRLAREIGALTASLDGLDGLVFTAGIGEHAPQIRAMTVEKLFWLGAKLDADANTRNAEIINTSDSKLAVLVIPTNEEEMIARHTLSCIA